MSTRYVLRVSIPLERKARNQAQVIFNGYEHLKIIDLS